MTPAGGLSRTRKQEIVMAQDYTDAIALLKADHRAVEELFEKFESAGESKKQAIAH